MARCELTGKRPRNRNRVSHSNIKTKAQSWPNVQSKRMFSRVLGQMIRLKLGSSTIKSIEHQGGLDVFLLNQRETLLSAKALEVKRRIQRKMRTSRQGVGQ